MPNHYIEFQNPVSVQFSRTIPVFLFYTMKSYFLMTRWFYIPNSLASGGIGTLKNQRHKWKYT